MRAGVASIPACRRASRLKDHHTALPVPISTAEMSSGRDFGQTNQLQLSCGRCAVCRGDASGRAAPRRCRYPRRARRIRLTPCANGRRRRWRSARRQPPPNRAGADRRPGEVPPSRLYVPSDEVGVGREGEPSGGTSHQNSGRQDRRAGRARDHGHPDRRKRSSESDRGACTAPDRHPDYPDVGHQVGGTSTGGDQPGRARADRQLGLHLRQQQPVAVARQPEADRDHRRSRQHRAVGSPCRWLRPGGHLRYRCEPELCAPAGSPGHRLSRPPDRRAGRPAALAAWSARARPRQLRAIARVHRDRARTTHRLRRPSPYRARPARRGRDVDRPG